MLFFFIYIFWLIRSALQIFFWLYLWQLKQYHTGRFLDHFKTTNGKKLIFHPFQWGKVVFALISPYLLLVAYITEPFLRARRFPSWTKKTIFLALISVLLYTVLPIFAESIWLLVLADLFLPVCVSLVVLIFQPLSYLFRSSLQKKAGKKREELDLKVVAITGSYAKTSTKEYLSTILSYRFNVSSTKDHQNTEVAIPRAILNLDKSCDIFIAELGAYDKGTIKRICRFLNPQIGIVTGINEQHLSLFGSMENLLSAEGGQELLDCLPEDGMLVCNIENGYGADLLQAAKIKKIPYSYADLKELTVNADKVSFKYDGQEFNCDVLGKHNALNLLGAIKVAKELGMSNEEILRGIRKIHSSTKVIKGKYNIIDSSYSA
ncbi:hypothetical protein KKG36_01145, partial [Patescibacteria group bacterium]|nr:hypothetical protein [Patescibacteria group bacterium]